MMHLKLSSQPATAHLSSNYGKTFESKINIQPILDMLSLFSQAGKGNFDATGVWETLFCALILRLEPHCRVQRILEALPYDDNPMDEADFLNAMANLGYYCRKTNLKPDEIDHRLIPCVVIPNSKNSLTSPFMIIGKDEQGQFLGFDPITQSLDPVKVDSYTVCTCWFFSRYDENRARVSKFMRKGSERSWFIALLGRFQGTFIQIMSTGFFLNLIALITPIYIMMVYDRVIATGSMTSLPMFAVGALIAITFEYILRRIRSTGLSWLAGRLDNVVVNKIFAHLIGLAPQLIEKASVSSQIARIKTFESIRDFFSSAMFLSVLDIPFVIISIAAIYWIAGSLVFIPMTMALGFMILFYSVRRQVMVSIRIAAKTSSARQQFTIETFEKLDSIKGHGLEKKWSQKFRQLSGREMMSHFQLNWLGLIAETLAHKLTIISAVSTVGYGVGQIWSGHMTAGALIASMVLVWRILTPFYCLCTMIPRLEQLRNSVLQINDLMEIETEAEIAKSFSRLPKLKGGISFYNVSLRYSEDGDEIFSGLTFEAKPGELVAITGVNGTGKATILKMIQSLHRPTSGMVRIDGFDIRQLDAPHLRRQIAYVPKLAEFFSGTIIENMRLSNPLVSIDTILKALEMADVHHDIQKLPNGLNTKIGANSDNKLSSVVATKLSLARAYLNNASILLIDELPNTILVSKTGENLKRYLANAKGKRTIVFCSYREDFMKLADTVIYLRETNVPIVGRKEEVLQTVSRVIKRNIAA